MQKINEVKAKTITAINGINLEITKEVLNHFLSMQWNKPRILNIFNFPLDKDIANYNDYLSAKIIYRYFMYSTKKIVDERVLRFGFYSDKEDYYNLAIASYAQLNISSLDDKTKKLLNNTENISSRTNSIEKSLNKASTDWSNTRDALNNLINKAEENNNYIKYFIKVITTDPNKSNLWIFKDTHITIDKDSKIRSDIKEGYEQVHLLIDQIFGQTNIFTQAHSELDQIAKSDSANKKAYVNRFIKNYNRNRSIFKYMINNSKNNHTFTSEFISQYYYERTLKPSFFKSIETSTHLKDMFQLFNFRHAIHQLCEIYKDNELPKVSNYPYIESFFYFVIHFFERLCDYDLIFNPIETEYASSNIPKDYKIGRYDYLLYNFDYYNDYMKVIIYATERLKNKKPLTISEILNKEKNLISDIEYEESIYTLLDYLKRLKNLINKYESNYINDEPIKAFSTSVQSNTALLAYIVKRISLVSDY